MKRVTYLCDVCSEAVGEIAGIALKVSTAGREVAPFSDAHAHLCEKCVAAIAAVHNQRMRGKTITYARAEDHPAAAEQPA